MPDVVVEEAGEAVDDPSERATSLAKAISEAINGLSTLVAPFAGQANVLLAVLDDFLRLTEPELLAGVIGAEGFARFREQVVELRPLIIAWGGAGDVPEDLKALVGSAL